MKLQNIIFTLLILFGTFQIYFGQEKVIDHSCQIPFQLKLFKEDRMLFAKDKNSDSNIIGDMYLLLEPQYFKPQKLKSLFSCLSKKHPKYVSLYITAYSSEENLKLAIRSKYEPRLVEHPGSDTSKEDCKNLAKAANPCPYGYYRARYYRGRNEQFFYSPNPNSRNMMKVILRKNL
jgi:hypothetical protein